MATVTSVLSSDQITALIQQASANFQAPATALQAQEKPIQTQISALGDVQGALSGLQSALSGLVDVQTLAQRTVTTSPDGAVNATATNDAAPGNYVLSNIQLAQSETLVSTGFASTSGSLGAGSLTIQVGSGSPVTLNIASGQDDLADIATAINQANTGVKASVVFDGSNYRLELAGAVGAANSFTVSGTGGLSGLSSSGASGLTQIQAAGDAQFSLNGIAITSGSNTISGAVTGLTFTLAASGTATVTVSQDVSALDTAADGVVTALNQVLSTINKYASFDPTSGAGPLLGDINVQLVRTQLLNAISSPTAAGGLSNSNYGSLASIGFSITSGGTIALDDTAFKAAAQADYGAVASLLANAGTPTDSRVAIEDAALAKTGRYSVAVTENNGGTIIGIVNGQAASGTNGDLTVNGPGDAQGLKLHIGAGITGGLGTIAVTPGLFSTLSNVVSTALTSGSGVTGEITNLNSTVSSLNQQIAVIQQQAQQQTLALTQQFSVAQATLSQLSTVSNFLTTYFDQTSSNGSGG
ncbi:MAG TPA: flagellar filament capping protein FliD [Stellaceae bacterium]|jgi:flagellar hook-associated protein 2|nr:flagellar filament capping protein FliD [Stellaceae bacterium]